MLAIGDGDYKHYDFMVDHLIYQSVAATAQFDFVAVRERVQAVGFNARI